jgi:hypothetical protein
MKCIRMNLTDKLKISTLRIIRHDVLENTKSRQTSHTHLLEEIILLNWPKGIDRLNVIPIPMTLLSALEKIIKLICKHKGL